MTKVPAGPSDAREAGSPQAEFLLDVVQGLLDSESKRDDAVNTRAVAVVALCGVMLALTATISGAALKGGVDRCWRVLALVLLTLAIGALCGAAAMAMLGVLRPRRFAMLATEEVQKFTTAEYLQRSDHANRQVLLTGMVEILEHERVRSAQKAAWLRRSYMLILVAVAALAITGAIGEFRAAGIISVRHGASPHRPAQAAGAGAGRSCSPARAAAPAAAHRVRREGHA